MGRFCPVRLLFFIVACISTSFRVYLWHRKGTIFFWDMQIFGQENEFFMSFSSFFYKYTICQRSFRSFLKYRTIVLHFLFPSLVHHSPVHSIVQSYIRSIVHRFHPLIRVGHNYYLLFVLLFIYLFFRYLLPSWANSYPILFCIALSLWRFVAFDWHYINGHFNGRNEHWRKWKGSWCGKIM